MTKYLTIIVLMGLGLSQDEEFIYSTLIDNMLGNVVNHLVNEAQNSGYQSVIQDATNNQGNPVSAGVYLYSIEAGNFIQTKKMIFLK